MTAEPIPDGRATTTGGRSASDRNVSSAGRGETSPSASVSVNSSVASSPSSVPSASASNSAGPSTPRSVNPSPASSTAASSGSVPSRDRTVTSDSGLFAATRISNAVPAGSETVGDCTSVSDAVASSSPV